MREDRRCKELQEEIADLIQKNETLNRQLVKTWRDMVRLADTLVRVDRENRELRGKNHACGQE